MFIKKIFKIIGQISESEIPKWILRGIFVASVITVVWRLMIIQWLIERLQTDVLTVLSVLVLLVIVFIASVDFVKKQMQNLDNLDKIQKLSDTMNNFAKTINTITEIVDKVKEKSWQLIETTCSILKDVAHLNIKKEIVKKEKELVTEGFEAVKLNYQTWSNCINQAEDEIIQKNWLYYLKTYFREEAFDIQRRELVTNARNYPFLLITTLLALIKFIEDKNEENKKVYFYAVTPVHPKDWYNWPHGREKPRRYYEIPFMGKYRRILREINKWNKNAKICLGRFLLVASDDSVSKQFGWELDPYERVVGTNPADIHMKDWKIFDVSVTLKDLESYHCIHRIYEYFVENDEEKFFTPLLCNKKFVYEGVAKKLSTSVDLEILMDEINAITAETIPINSEIFSKQLEKDLKELKEINNDKLKQLVETIEDYTNASPNVNIFTFIEKIQYLSLLLPEKHTLIEDILLNTLRMKDFQNKLSWCTLLEKYVNDLHSDDGQVGVISLQNGNNNSPFYINYWKDDMPSEFAMFGVGTKEANIEWKIVLMTDLDYPFKVSGIKLLTCDDKDQRRKEKFEKFKSIMSTFLSSRDNLYKFDLRK